MKIKRLRYSERSGFSFELFEPNTFRIDTEQVMMLLILLKSELNQKELNTHFEYEEQKVLQKYIELQQKKQVEMSTQYIEKGSTQKLFQELSTQLDWYFECYQDDWQKKVLKYYGWQLIESEIKNMLPPIDP